MSLIQKYRVLTTTTVLMCAGLLSSTAQGQMEYMAEAMQPEYFSRDLVVFAEGLNLDDTQEVIVGDGDNEDDEEQTRKFSALHKAYE